MSVFSYRLIPLQVTDVVHIGNRPVMSSDGVDYLYTEWTFHVNAVFNPAATALAPKRNAGNPDLFGPNAGDEVPGAGVGMFPAKTHNALQEYLMQPRGRLFVKMGNGVVVESPSTGKATDANNGPIVEYCNVTQIFGERTWNVEFRIKTWTNYCDHAAGNGDKNPLVSHRWTRSVDHDQDYFATVTTVGEAVFRADVLEELDTFPDQYRINLFHSIPQHFRREGIEVTPSSDGNRITYRIVDTEKPLDIGNQAKCNRIESYITSWIQEGNMIKSMVLGGINGGIQGLAGAMGFGAIPGAIAGAIGGLVRAMPTFRINCLCRVWGIRTSSKETMMRIALAVCNNRLNLAPMFKAKELIITQDVAGKFVQVDMTMHWGIESEILHGGVNGLLAILRANPIEQQIAMNAMVQGLGDAVGGNLGIDRLMRTIPPSEFIMLADASLQLNTNTGNPAPQNAAGTRGSWLGRLVAQSISTPCSQPDDPDKFAGIDQVVHDLDIL